MTKRYPNEMTKIVLANTKKIIDAYHKKHETGLEDI